MNATNSSTTWPASEAKARMRASCKAQKLVECSAVFAANAPAPLLQCGSQRKLRGRQPRSERRPLAGPAIRDARRQQCPVSLLLGGADKDLGAGLDVFALAHLVGYHDGLRRHHELFLAVLVLDQQQRTIDAGHSLLDIAIGHLALGQQV